MIKAPWPLISTFQIKGQSPSRIRSITEMSPSFWLVGSVSLVARSSETVLSRVFIEPQHN